MLVSGGDILLPSEKGPVMLNIWRIKQVAVVGLTLTVMFLMLGAERVASQDFPLSALQNYRDFRTALIKSGWKPVPNSAFKQADGTWTYEFPELVCGNSMCTAAWTAKNGKEFALTVWWDDAGEWRVAPQWE